MKILVTGGTGFLGRHVVWRLAAEGHDIIFTGRNASSADVVKKLCSGRVEWQPIEHGSHNAKSILIKKTANVNAIIHCAALSSPWGPLDDFFRANVDSTGEVLAAGEAADIQRLIHISTPSIYFDFKDRLNIKESQSLPLPVNNYALTKLQAEQLVTRSRIQSVILRPRAIFGPWDNTLMPRLIRVMQRGPIPIMRGGTALMDVTYIDNLVDAICLSLTKPLLRQCSTYNVSNGSPLEFIDLLEKLANNFHLSLRTKKIHWRIFDLVARLFEMHAHITKLQEPLLTRYTAGVLAFSQTLDISAITNELGYRPKVSVDDGLQRHAAWYATLREPK